MELQFQKQTIPCLGLATQQLTKQMFAQELRLPETLPDAERVIESWGQVQIRSKSWKRDSVSISGGVCVWILYETPDGEVVTAEEWLPFNMDWDLPQKAEDGILWVCPNLSQLHARCLSDRKLSIRACVEMLVRAFVMEDACSWEKMELPEDVELLSGEQELSLMTEAGECSFSIDEMLTVDAGRPQPEMIVSARICPRINEQKVMGGKMVFRGTANVHVVYRAGNGLHTMDWELPFAQYSPLEQVHEPEAHAWVQIVLTGLELHLEESGLHIQADLIGQYMICDNKVLHTVVDGYSTERQWKNQFMPIKYWQAQQEPPQTLKANCAWEGSGRLVDTAFYPSQPENGQLEGEFRFLYYDSADKLQSETCKWEQSWDQCGWISAMEGQDTLCLTPMQMQQLENTVMTAMELGEPRKKENNGPSLVLRRLGDDSLWDLAKKTGSTIRKIQKASGIEGVPSPNEMLLIPM